ncbi:hypothetical protein [Bradyrhizobium sp. AUGA SZCCT0182]|uniref:hypothetical protein n=1 Tax=Bradyrhizobium sp. AUGA SZCCT0182 TaxID=2807667 RepID=UPI001BA9576D|nr:hypothetical protein [Bradyrhizobium sp. AUGA SZCCT0182]MBR1236528.1 hypothetical protein [Bradyrhizobium sp. AUGA SZCCT0182]
MPVRYLAITMPYDPVERIVSHLIRGHGLMPGQVSQITVLCHPSEVDDWTTRLARAKRVAVMIVRHDGCDALHVQATPRNAPAEVRR